uniref:Uncharacterized protein n=1 Tax=Geospiza parvula TaxID=87175 RepID=A0A8U8BMP0_GEOPR
TVGFPWSAPVLSRLLGAGRGGAPARGPPPGTPPRANRSADAGPRPRARAGRPAAPAHRAPREPRRREPAGRRRAATTTTAAAAAAAAAGAPAAARRRAGGGGRAAPAAAGAIHGKGPGARPESPPRARARAPAPGRATRSALTRARGLVQPRRAPSPASRPSPTDPALRANPYPEVTDPACRLPLTYIVPTCQRLFTLETCCGYGYGPARDLHPLPRIFTGQRELTGRRRNRDAFQGAGPSLGANPFQGARPFTKKKRTLPGAPAGFSGIGCVTALGASRRPSPPLRIRGS